MKGRTALFVLDFGRLHPEKHPKREDRIHRHGEGAEKGILMSVRMAFSLVRKAAMPKHTKPSIYTMVNTVNCQKNSGSFPAGFPSPKTGTPGFPGWF
jgi:hypothetical protein